jgi:hypothetical protein
MDAGTRYDPPSIREHTEEEEHERALSECENNDRAEMTSECTPRWSSVAPLCAEFALAVIYSFPHSIYPY